MKKLNRKLILIIAGGAVGICAICLVITIIYSNTPAYKANRTSEAIAASTKAAQPTNTPLPTSTEKPTEIPTQTNTPQPTDTPVPTLPPTETLTPTPPPEPILLKGKGDDIVDFENPFNVSIAHIVGNKSSVYFGVINYAADGTKLELLVNATDPYDGIRPLDFAGTHTTRFEITAAGAWTIEILPITSARVLTVPGKIEGKGDEIIRLEGAQPDIALIKGNKQSSYFGVIAYGSTKDLLVNATDPYDGKVILSKDTLVLEIIAIGPWTIDITGK